MAFFDQLPYAHLAVRKRWLPNHFTVTKSLHCALRSPKLSRSSRAYTARQLSYWDTRADYAVRGEKGSGHLRTTQRHARRFTTKPEWGGLHGVVH